MEERLSLLKEIRERLYSGIQDIRKILGQTPGQPDHTDRLQKQLENVLEQLSVTAGKLGKALLVCADTVKLEER